MLLTVSFGKSNNLSAKPLTVKEWARFALWLRGQGLEPSALLEGDAQNLLSGWVDRSITLPRVESLLNRGGALGLALEKWQRAGLWVITRADQEYPERLKRRLGSESPPVLFGCGNKKLLEHGGIAVVGSRDASEEELTFTEYLGDKAAGQGYNIVSGGARGVDQSAMFGALQNEGTAVGVLADSLLSSATSAKYRRFILSGDLALISPNNPEVGFDVGKAMSRNRYVYCLADAAIVISSTAGKGGTWNGALEGVKAGWVPVWVKRSSYSSSGNSGLVDCGAHWLPETLGSLASLLTSPPVASPKGVPSIEDGLFEESTVPSEAMQMELMATLSAPPDNEVAATSSRAQESQNTTTKHLIPSDISFYELFLARCAKLTSATPLTSDEIAGELDIAKVQILRWLKRGVSDKAIKRFTKPVRYQSNDSEGTQASLLSGAD